MIRGTTPTHDFDVPFDTNTIDELEIAYSQGKDVVLIKTKDECELNGNNISVQLTQDETLRFKEGFTTIQLRVLREGTVMACKAFVIPVGRCLNGDVME